VVHQTHQKGLTRNRHFVEKGRFNSPPRRREDKAGQDEPDLQDKIQNYHPSLQAFVFFAFFCGYFDCSPLGLGVSAVKIQYPGVFAVSTGA
jgi:hypothetical protein